MIKASEIRDGIVLRLEPDEFEAAGAVCADTDFPRVQGPHFFLCVAANEETGNWVPLFESPGPYREFVVDAHKAGSAGWRESTTYFHAKQVWQAPHSAVVEAAIAGGDLSQPDSRNTLTDAGVDAVYEILFGG